MTTTTTSVAARSDLRARFHDVRTVTEGLAQPLSAEDQTVQTMPDVSPTKWHRAHTTWFFETFLLGPHAPGYEVVDPAYGYLFNSYYEGVGPRHARPQRGFLTRPGIAEIADYRRAVDAAMDDLLADELAPDVAALVELGINHEQQHQELLLMDIKHVLASNPLRPAYAPDDQATPRPPTPSAEWIAHPGGVVRTGHGGDGFHFDNEGPRHDQLVGPFALRSSLVTAGEWLEFVDDGGYRRPALWMSDGWAAVQAERWEAPGYWTRDADGWSVQTLCGPRPVDVRRPGGPRELVRGRRLRPLGRLSPAHRDRVGGRGLRPRRRGPRGRRRGRCTRRRPAAGAARCGSGRPAPTRPTRGSGPLPARSASTTASSW